MRYLPYIRYAVPVLLVGYVLAQALLSYPLTGTSQLHERTRFLGMLLPAGRVERVAAGMRLVGEPVYLDVRLPPRAQAYELEFITAPGSLPLKLGVRQGRDWSYDFPKVEATPTSTSGTTYRITVASVPYAEPDHAARVIISAPELSQGSITVARVQVRLMREPVSFAWLWRAIKQAL